jgi:NAD(P)-dependent dehydrogenase (short-subunit alcohol dehydrogenase family)
LTGRVAVITGCSSGIGRATALAFAEAGADVAGLDVLEEQGEETASAVRSLGRRAIFQRCDVSQEEAVTAAFAATEAEFGRIDILVNNAFVGTHSRPADMELTEWQRVIDVDLTGYFLCARAAGRHMIASGHGGAIVNLSSIGGSLALGRGNFAYSVAKGGINQMTRELAIEWAPYGIRVNAIQPCWVRTPALQALIDDPQFDSDTLVATFISGVPLRRLAEPEDIALAATFLASRASGMITGAMLPVDGGNLALNAGGTVEWSHVQ